MPDVTVPGSVLPKCTNLSVKEPSGTLRMQLCIQRDQLEWSLAASQHPVASCCAKQFLGELGQKRSIIFLSIQKRLQCLQWNPHHILRPVEKLFIGGRQGGRARFQIKNLSDPAALLQIAFQFKGTVFY